MVGPLLGERRKCEERAERLRVGEKELHCRDGGSSQKLVAPRSSAAPAQVKAPGLQRQFSAPSVGFGFGAVQPFGLGGPAFGAFGMPPLGGAYPGPLPPSETPAMPTVM